MDAWPIGYKPAKPPTSPETERAKKRKVDKQYDSAKRVRTFQPAWLVGRKWLARDGDGSMFCKACRLNAHKHADPGRFTVGTSSFQITSIKSHEMTMSHQRECLAVEAAAKPAMDSKAGKMLVTLNRALTEKLRIKFRSVHALAKHDRPFMDYVWQCELDELKGITVGQDYRSDKAAADFAHHIAEVSDCEI